MTRLAPAATLIGLALIASPALADEVDDLLAKGEQAFVAGNEQAALESFLEVTQKAPERWEGFYYAGMVLHVTGKADEAIEMYEKAIAIKPDASEALNNLSVLYLESGDLDKALETSRKAVKADPQNFEAAYTLGEILETRGQLEEAVQAYLGAAEVAPGDPDPLLAVADISLGLGKKADAARALAKAFKRAPHQVDIGLMALELLREAGLDEEALAAARALAKRIGPKAAKNVEAAFRVARVLRLLGEPAGALALLAKLPKDARASFSVQTEIGLAHLALGGCKKASKAFDKALVAKPGNPVALVAKADALCCAGKWWSAKKAYKKFLKKASKDDPHVSGVKKKLKKGTYRACKKKKKK